jgi:hypothetical protein
MTTIDFSINELELTRAALHTQRRELERKLARLQKSAGGRNYLANERQQESLRKQLDELRALGGRLDAERRAFAAAVAAKLTRA